MARLNGQYVPPGVYAEENFESPVQGTPQNARIPVIVGTGNEILTRQDLAVVRGSSSFVDQQIPQEDETGRAVVNVLQSGQVVLGDFNGTRRLIQVRNYPLVSGNGSGTLATSTSSISATINDQPIVVLSIFDAEKGIIELATAPKFGDDVRITYFYNRTDTLTTDDVSDQVSASAAIIDGQRGQPSGGYIFEADTAQFAYRVDGDIDNPVMGTFGIGTRNVETLASLINGAAVGTSLVASVFTNNFGLKCLRLSADISLEILDSGSNTVLGFTPGTSTNRRRTFHVFNRPIVVGDNGGVTTTDPSKVRVTVNGEEVTPLAVEGQFGSVTLPFAPPSGSKVLITYYFNTWQDTFDYLQHINVVDVLACGIVPGNSDYIEGSDFILKNDQIHWGTSYTVSEGETVQGTLALGPTQISGLLVDQKSFLSLATPVVDSSVSPPVVSKVTFRLPFEPTTGNGRNSPLGSVEFDKVANGRVDLPTNNPHLVQAYWGFDLQDAIERGPVEVIRVDGNQITLKDPVPVGATVWSSFYYNTITDAQYTIEVNSSGPSGVGTYFIKDRFGNKLFTPSFGQKGPALTGVALEFPSGSELAPDVRFEGGSSGPVEETVTVQFASTDGTLAKYTAPGSDPYYFIEGASDRARILVDNIPLAGGSAGISLANPNGVEGLGFPASLLGDEVQYDVASGQTTYDILEGVNDSVSVTVDGVTINATVAEQSGVDVSAYVTALNATAKLEAYAPFYDATTRFLGSVAITPGKYDQLRFNYTGNSSGATGPVTVTIPAGIYTSPTALAAAVGSAFATAISALPSDFDGLGIGVSTNANGQLRFMFKGADQDLGTFASGTVTVVAPERFEEVEIGGVSLTADLSQDPGGRNFDNGSARATITANGIRLGDTVSLDIGGGPVVLTGASTQTPGSFNVGIPASGSIEVDKVLPGDTLTIAGKVLTASGSQTPGGADFDEGTRSTGTVTLTNVEYGDEVWIGGVKFTASNTQTSGGFDFNIGEKAGASIQTKKVRLGDQLTINGQVYLAATAQIGGMYNFNAGTQAVGNITCVGVRLGDQVTIGGVTLQAASSITPGNADFNAGTPATGSFTVTAAPAAAQLTIDGITLVPAGGPRTPGNDDYDETLGSEAAIAAEIAAAINDPANSFVNVVSAVQNGNDVDLIAVTPGSAGDAITTASDDASVMAAAATLSGGVGDDDTAAASLKAAIDDPTNGLTDLVVATVLSNQLVVRVLTPGAAGNSTNLTSSDPVRLAVVPFAGGIGDDDTAAASLAAAINDPLNVPTSDEMVAVADGDTVQLEAVVPGAAGNSLTLVTANPSRILLSGSSFTGGSGTDITAASSLVAAILDAMHGLSTMVIPSNLGGTTNVVTIDAYIPGIVGNAITLSTTGAPRITLSGATLAGGVGTNDTVAASIAAAIADAGNGLTNIVSSSANTNKVSLSAVTPGNAGNLITLASNSSTRIALSGTTLAGGSGTDISAASSLAAAINDLANGLSLTLKADNEGGTSDVVTVWAATPGLAGNAYALASSNGSRIVLSGPMFTGGMTDDQIASSLVAAILDAGNGLTSRVTADNNSGASNVVDVEANDPGSLGNLITLSSSSNTSLAVSAATLLGGTDLPGGYFEFIDATTAGEDFAILAGISTDKLPGESQTKILDGDIARRFTIAGDSGRLVYDRVILRNRIVPGSGSIHSASQVLQTKLEVQGNNAISETGLKPQMFGLANISATVEPASLFGEVGFVDGQVPSGTYNDARDGQPLVRFYAEGGVNEPNNVFKVNIDGTPFTVVFASANGTTIPNGGFADVPFGPVSIANTVLNQIRSAAVAQGLSPNIIRQEGAGYRIISQLDDENSSITIGNGNANDRLGVASGATASRTPVEARSLVSALMSHAALSLPNVYLDYQNPTDTYFAGQALAGVATDNTGAEYLFLQSQGNNVVGLGTNSNLALLQPSMNSWLLSGTGLNAQVGDGASGEAGVIGYYVTSSDPKDGSGSRNNSVFNNGVGQDGYIGQTYRDSKTGLTFTILDRADGGTYPTGAGAHFTFKVRNLVTANANIPVNTIPGLELRVSNTTGIEVGNTAIVDTFEKGGNEPSVGDFYYVTYNYRKNLSVPTTKIFTEQRLVEQEYGPANPDHAVSLGAKLAFQNGAQIVAITQIPKEPNSNQASVESYIAAFNSLRGRLPGGLLPSTITPLRGDSLEIFTALKQHCEIQSSKRFRAERTAIVGVNAGIQPTEVGGISQNINSSRVTLIYPDIATVTSRDAMGNSHTFLIDSTFLACCEAGGRASPDVDVATPRDRKQIAGISSLLRSLDEVEMDTIATQGVTLYEQVGNVIRVRESLTTSRDQTNPAKRIPQITTSVDEVKRALRKDLDRFIGGKKFPSTMTEVKGQATETLKALKRQQIITDYRGVSVREDVSDPTLIQVRASIMPVYPLLVIEISLDIRASLE